MYLKATTLTIFLLIASSVTAEEPVKVVIGMDFRAVQAKMSPLGYKFTDTPFAIAASPEGAAFRFTLIDENITLQFVFDSESSEIAGLMAWFSPPHQNTKLQTFNRQVVAFTIEEDGAYTLKFVPRGKPKVAVQQAIERPAAGKANRPVGKALNKVE